MDDYIIRASAKGGFARVFAALSRNTTEKSRKLHNTSPVATAALGRTLTGTAMMGLMLKNEGDLITVSIKGDGPLGGILVTANKNADVKGYVLNPDVFIPSKPNGKLDVSGAVGGGTLSIVRDSGLKEPYVGKIPLVSGEIAEDLTYYFAKSEQIPTSIGLGVLVDVDGAVLQAGGFIVQLLPGCDAAFADELQQKITEMPTVTTLLSSGKSIEEIIEDLIPDIEIFEKLPMRYHCDCSRERIEKALIAVGRDDLTKIIKEDHGAEICCHFCDKTYKFNEAELTDLRDSQE